MFTWSEPLTSLGLSFPYVKKNLDKIVLEAALIMLEDSDLVLGFLWPGCFLGTITTRSCVLGLGGGWKWAGRRYKILEEQTEEAVGQNPAHTYSSSS